MTIDRVNYVCARFLHRVALSVCSGEALVGTRRLNLQCVSLSVGIPLPVFRESILEFSGYQKTLVNGQPFPTR